MSPKRLVLPTSIRPKHYELKLDPDFQKFTFAGDLKIHIEVLQAADKIVLNSAEISFLQVRLVKTNYEVVSCTGEDVILNSDDETATIPIKVEPGTAILHIQYTGIINDKMRGFYRSKWTTKNDETRYFGCTQFESVDARRALPCWDEPNIKASFDVEFIVDRNLTALSNMPEKSVIAIDDRKRRVTFQTSPVMSTYLLAWCIGEFDQLQSHTVNGTWVSIYTPVGHLDKAKFALDVACKVLPLYEKYFEIPYPLPKLDMVALTEFTSGAMENWGLVTYRDSCIYADENSAQSHKEWVCTVVTHELSHQWFGNLVTMDWWSELWLNEGFASFMETMASDWLFPKWTYWTDFVHSTLDSALSLDALKSSHPIEVPIYHPKEVDEIFDTISYEKGGSVVRMIHNFLGAETFRLAIRNYLNEFKHKNAKTTDLWEHLSKESGQNVTEIMSNFTLKQGFPIIEAEKVRDEGTEIVVKLRQSRFLRSGRPSENEDTTIWHVPILININGESEKTVLMNKKEMEIRLPKGWIKLNAQASGVFRVAYDKDLMGPLSLAARNLKLNPLDRLNLICDFGAMAQAGYCKSTDLLEYLQQCMTGKGTILETDQTVWSTVATALSIVYAIVQHMEEKVKTSFHNFACGVFQQITDKIGWTPKADEPERDKKLRALCIGTMLKYDNPPVTKEAKRLFESSTSENIISADFRGSVYKSIVKHGGVDGYEAIYKLHKSDTDIEEKSRIFRALGAAKDENLLKRTLKWALSGEILDQDISRPVFSVAMNTSGTQIAWEWFQENFALLREKFPHASNFGSFASVGSSFCSKEKSDECTAFFADKDTMGYDRVVKQMIEAISLRSEYLERDRDSLSKWLSNLAA